MLKPIFLAILLILIVIVTPGCMDNIEEMNKNARTLANSGRYDDALVIYEKILEIEPNNLDALHGRGKCQSYLGDYEKSNIAYSRIEQIDPDDGYALLSMAENYENLGRHSVAVCVYDRAGTAFMNVYKKGGMTKEQYDELSKKASDKLIKAHLKSENGAKYGSQY